jgi:plastocyanin
MPFFRPAGLPAIARAGVAALVIFVVSAGPPALAQSDDPRVDMKNFAYVPTQIHISAGQTVTWTNGDYLAHTVTADDGSFDSGYIGLGGTFSKEFDTPGTYQYYCAPHGGPGLVGMAATVIVDG